jgi:hypothetical protein
MSARGPFRFWRWLSFACLFTDCQHYEMLPDACLQGSVQARFDPDR